MGLDLQKYIAILELECYEYCTTKSLKCFSLYLSLLYSYDIIFILFDTNKYWVSKIELFGIIFKNGVIIFEE